MRPHQRPIGRVKADIPHYPIFAAKRGLYVIWQVSGHEYRVEASKYSKLYQDCSLDYVLSCIPITHKKRYL